MSNTTLSIEAIEYLYEQAMQDTNQIIQEASRYASL